MATEDKELIKDWNNLKSTIQSWPKLMSVPLRTRVEKIFGEIMSNDMMLVWYELTRSIMFDRAGEGDQEYKVFSRLWLRLPNEVQGNLGKFIRDALATKPRKNINTEITPAQESDPLGRWAFAEDREDVPWEEDTPKESHLFHELGRHYVNGSTMSEPDADLIKTFLSHGLYADYFIPCKQDELYRGINVSEDWLKGALGEQRFEIEITQSSEGECSGNFTFVPYSGIGATSWTGVESVARGFSKNRKEYDVVLFALVSDNPDRFCSCPEDDVPGGVAVSGESEFLGLGEIKIYKFSWRYHAAK
jgi:hypothetical protein